MKEKCVKHPDRKSLAPCHSCKKYYCEDCLTVGSEYYYCKDEQCQVLKKQEDNRFKVSEEVNTNLLQQKWKENGRKFYKKIFKILGISWIFLSVFLFIALSYNFKKPYLSPILSLIICLKCFVWVWFIRTVFYKHLIWEKRVMREVQENYSSD